MRFDIISDTHGKLTKDLLLALEGADVIVHAGDICSASDFKALQKIAPVYACLGNNDWNPYAFGPQVKKLTRFVADGLKWCVAHYERQLDLMQSDIAVCGHTHRSFIKRDPRFQTLIINPGSPSYPRDLNPSLARLVTKDGALVDVKIVSLND